MKRRLILFFCVALVLNAVQAQDKPFEEDDNTTALLHFDGNLENVSDNENPGKSKSKARFVSGVFGKALIIEKAGEILTLPELDDELSVARNPGITVELWIKPQREIGKFTAILCRKYTGGPYSLNVYNNELIFVFYSKGKWHSLKTGAKLKKQMWQHIAWTYDASRKIFSIFLNGVKMFSQNLEVPMIPFSGKKKPLMLGGNFYNGKNLVKCAIDEFRFSDIVRYDSDHKAETGTEVFKVKAF
jgi:hypothetical protein